MSKRKARIDSGFTNILLKRRVIPLWYTIVSATGFSVEASLTVCLFAVTFALYSNFAPGRFVIFLQAIVTKESPA
jgi:hypothetical protein